MEDKEAHAQALLGTMTVSTGKTTRVLVCFGTRPEVIKLAPLILRLKSLRSAEVTVLCTGQHRDLVESAAESFGIRADIDLEVMTENQPLSLVAAQVLRRIDPVIARLSPDWVVVQGDTTSAFAVALGGYLRSIPVAHVEAGLRTYDRANPFPEEANRQLITKVAEVHFAPTVLARERLVAEGIPPNCVFVTGNTAIDAVLLMATAQPKSDPQVGTRRILVTTHRRESWSGGLERICRALRVLASKYRHSAEFIFPVHPNPKVRSIVERELLGVRGVKLRQPMGYQELVRCLTDSYLVMTDSGGLQEEAPAVNKPVLVLREKTERTEGIRAGTALIVGTDVKRIISAFETLWTDSSLYLQMTRAPNPFGDGKAARRIAEVLLGRSIEEFSPAIETTDRLAKE